MRDQLFLGIFAGFFPLWDILFGTYYMPKGKVPTEFGIDEPMPNTLAGQMIFPFRSPPSNSAKEPNATILP